MAWRRRSGKPFGTASSLLRSDGLQQLLQRTFAGHIPSVRRDVFNLVLPVDFTNPKDLEVVVNGLQNFVKQKVAIRIGIVPITPNPSAERQAKAVYYLVDTYGVDACLAYLQKVLRCMDVPRKHADQRPVRSGKNATILR
jgi:hypothetical protein